MKQWHYFILRAVQLRMNPRQIGKCIGYSRVAVTVYLGLERRRYGVRTNQELIAKMLKGVEVMFI